jgi:hypothetical protein
MFLPERETNMTRGRSTVFKIHFWQKMFPFCWIILAFSIFVVGIDLKNVVKAESGGESKDGAKKGKANASITPGNKKLIFTTPDGTIIRTIPLLNKKVEISKTPSGNITYTSYDDVVISEDGSHAAIFTRRFANTGDVESTLTMKFRYYDSSGKLWEENADVFSNYGNALSSDGSRVLLNGSGIGGVYSQNGKILYPVSLGFQEIDNLWLSPNGKYVYSNGIVDYGKGTKGIRVIDLDNNGFFDFPYESGKGGIRNLHITSDGRFGFEYQSEKVVLPK